MQFGLIFSALSVLCSAQSPSLPNTEVIQQPVPLTPVFSQPVSLFSKLDWSWTGADMTVKDNAGRDFYHVNAKFWSIGQKFKITDAAGHVVLQSKQKIFTWKPKFIVEYLNTAGQWVDVDLGRKRFFDIRNFKTYTFEINGESFITQGDLFAWEFKVYSQRDGVEVAYVDIASQNLFRFDWPGAQTYSIQVDQARINPSVIVALLTILRSGGH